MAVAPKLVTRGRIRHQIMRAYSHNIRAVTCTAAPNPSSDDVRLV